MPTEIILSKGEIPAEHRREMRYIGSNGDTKVIWNARDADEVANAREQFEKLTGERRFLAFRVDPEGGQGERMREFDPDAQKMILVPPMAGGA